MGDTPLTRYFPSSVSGVILLLIMLSAEIRRPEPSSGPSAARGVRDDGTWAERFASGPLRGLGGGHPHQQNPQRGRANRPPRGFWKIRDPSLGLPRGLSKKMTCVRHGRRSRLSVMREKFLSHAIPTVVNSQIQIWQSSAKNIDWQRRNGHVKDLKCARGVPRASTKFCANSP